MTKLLDHFIRMQEMCTAYLTPEPYTTMIPGATPTTHDTGDEHARDQLFIGDMIYMLDGPEQREAQRAAVHQYPTEDAYMSTQRALHWRTGELRAAGIEPLSLATVNGGGDGVPHYPPEHFRFPITQAFRGDPHRQVYHAWRRYPVAMALSMFVGALLANLVTFAIAMVL